MKNILLLSLFIALLNFTSVGQSVKKQTATSSAAKIEAYYFHNTARCVTCKTLEEEAKADLKSLYGDQVSFQSLNLEEEATKPIAKKLKVSGQTLLVVKGDKQLDLTNKGFLYARTNPAKFKSIIKKEVDALINN